METYLIYYLTKLIERKLALALPPDTELFRSREKKTSEIAFVKDFFVILIKITHPTQYHAVPISKTGIQIKGGDGIGELPGAQ